METVEIISDDDGCDDNLETGVENKTGLSGLDSFLNFTDDLTIFLN